MESTWLLGELCDILDSVHSDSYSHNARASRPASSVHSRSNSSSNTSGGRRRAQSASVGRPATRSRDWDISSYVSPYALTSNEKELKEKREKVLKER